jgi:hypothetical protein
VSHARGGTVRRKIVNHGMSLCLSGGAKYRTTAAEDFFAVCDISFGRNSKIYSFNITFEASRLPNGCLIRRQTYFVERCSNSGSSSLIHGKAKMSLRIGVVVGKSDAKIGGS